MSSKFITASLLGPSIIDLKTIDLKRLVAADADNYFQQQLLYYC